MTDDQIATVLGFERTAPIQIRTELYTITGVIYHCDHREPALTFRGPEPGECTLFVVTAHNDRYRLQYTYYDEIDHTNISLDQYRYISDGQYSWFRTSVSVEAIIGQKEGDHL
ncbi:hypothetical protein [Haladaptatus salinisoli]|uniref:hypothetical protein n=1 Tax=Haladaptatus salinisoli TaxID=2884876 RepID=UPI001D09AFC5|nr:hypothetical protein [Haladaptatus salinisoli]